MIKLIKKSLRYASVLGKEDSAHGSSNLTKNDHIHTDIFDEFIIHSGLSNHLSLCRSLRKKFFDFTEVEPELFDVSSPFTLFRDYIREKHLSLADEHSSVLIQLCSFLYWIRQSKNLMDYSVATMSFLTNLGYNPVTLYLKWKIPSDIFNFSDTTVNTEGCENIVDNWRLLKSNPIFSKLSRSFSIISTLLVCVIEKRDFDISWVDTIHSILEKVHTSSFDAIDAIIESISWLCTSGVAIIKTGSITPLLFSNPLVREFDELFISVYSDRSRAINGDLDSLDLYEKKLRRCIEVIELLNNQKIDSVIRRYLHEKYSLLVSVQDSIWTKRKNCEMRFCPIGFSLFGGSGVGKTTVAKMIMRTSLASMGYPYGEDHQITLDMNDKYHSTLTNDIQGIFFDDLANTTSEFAANGQIPSSVIIKFFNNVPGQAIKADVSDKGKTMINLKCGIITTNKKDLDAHKYSNCPLSILRRLFHITVSIKPCFQSVSCGRATGMLDQQHPRLLDQKTIGEVDVWNFKVEVAVPGQGDSATFAVYEHQSGDNSINCERIDLRTLLTIVRDLSIEHKRAQDNLMLGSKSGGDTLCKSCFLPTPVCTCDSDHCEDIVETEGLFTNWYDPLLWLAPAFGYKPIDNIKPEFVLSQLVTYADKGFISIAPYLPDFIYQSPLYNYVFSYPASRLIDFEWDVNRNLELYFRKNAKHNLAIGFISLFLSYACDYNLWVPYVISNAVIILWISFLIEIRKQRRSALEASVINSRVQLSTLTKNYRDLIIPRCLLVFSGVSAVVIAFRYMYSLHINSSRLPQGSLDPEEVNKQPGWFGNLFRGQTQKVLSQYESNRLPSQTANTIKKNLFYAEYARDDGSSGSCCAFCPKTGVIIFPKHMFYVNGNMSTDPCSLLTITLRRHNSYGSTFLIVVHWEKCFFFGDLSITQFSNGPSLRDVTNIFSDSVEGRGYCEFVRRTPTFEIQTESVFATHDIVGHKHMRFKGSSYTSSLTGSGSCMSVLINSDTPSHIVGFHLGGNATIGVSMHLPREVLLEAISEVASRTCGTEGSELISYPDTIMGKPFISGPAHPMAYHNQLGSDTCFEVLGSSKLRMQSKSEVERGYFYDAMVDIMGIKDVWKAPNMLPNWKHYNKFLDKVTKPSLPFDPVHLCRAANDYIQPLLTKCKTFTGLRRKLTLEESVMGIPGVRFCDALIMSTSMGYPIFGKKKYHFTDQFDINGNLINRLPSHEVLSEIDRLSDCYKRGVRGCPVFTACLKDEVKDIDSEKVRVFTACPVAFSILVRMYYLPIIIFLKNYPRESEMAVGVNAFGLQWQDLMEHTDAFSDEDGGKFGMDYSSYDTRMNSQITRAVYSILIDLAVHLDYSEDDVIFMRNMVDDLTFPIVDVNGTLYQLYHMNPSGVNLTVEVNCIGNSLYMRLAFFSAIREANTFRDCVRLMTYGDDNKCSVKREYRKFFTFLTVQDYLGNHDIKITPPDKKSQGEHFFGDDKLDFLKRQSQYIPEINRSIGRLEENSIIKSLMYNVKSHSVSKKQTALACVDSAMHEWFAFGRNHYERRRLQLKQVCAFYGIENYPTLELDFDTRVRSWLDTYYPASK